MWRPFTDAPIYLAQGGSVRHGHQAISADQRATLNQLLSISEIQELDERHVIESAAMTLEEIGRSLSCLAFVEMPTKSHHFRSANFLLSTLFALIERAVKALAADHLPALASDSPL